MQNKNYGNRNCKTKKGMICFVIIAIIAIIAMSAVLIAQHTSEQEAQPLYESYFTMLVNRIRGEDATEPEEKILSSDITASQQLAPTCIEIIKSDSVLREVADEVERKTQEEFSVKSIREMMSVEAISDTTIIKVSVRSTDPAMAREIANTISDIAPEKIRGIVEGSEVKIIDTAKISNTPVNQKQGK